MEKRFENLRWVPRWVSHMGCVKGCLDFLNLDISDAWLYGGTGHAFIINVHEGVCPSGPTAWMTEMLGRLGANLGYVVDCTFGSKSEPDFVEKQRLAWEHVKRAIDQGVPCYGWELDKPEFYVVQGYADGEADGRRAAGYFYSGPGCDEGKGPKPWQELGDTEIGIIEMYSVASGEPADDTTAVREALSFALEHAENPDKWILPDYSSGLAGYDNWINAVEGGTADGFGMAYNAGVWNECRVFAVAFLKEARGRLGRPAAPFDVAIEHYSVAAQNLQTVVDTFPFHGMEPGHIEDSQRLQVAAACLRAAREAEGNGLVALESIVNVLQ
jgi:hypothetical protein